jgi:4-hydroxyphenylpyruvate dioxygenase
MNSVDRPSLEVNHRIQLRGIDYIEIYVGNVYQAAHFYRSTYGFTPVAYANLETGTHTHASTVLEQNGIRLILTGALTADSTVADYVRLHGDSVKDIAFTVDDAKLAFETAVARGARPVMEPTVLEDEGGRAVKASIGSIGDTVHSFIKRDEYENGFLPGYRDHRPLSPPVEPRLMSVDHAAICVGKGELLSWVEFYTRVLDFKQTYQEDVETEYSAMNSRVVEDQTGLIKFPIMEPARGRRRSQIEEYLTFHGGAGVQHIAFSSNDIIRTVGVLRQAGVGFLAPPPSYYKMLEDRIGTIKEGLTAIEQSTLLVDSDPWGYLIQCFTEPVHSRPTLFIEIIQRNNARGFGGGNVRALFEAVEMEQAKRRNL